MNCKKKILICGGTGCLSSKSEDIKHNLENYIDKYGIKDVEVILTGCFGFCEKGPIVKIVPENTFYIEVKPEDAEEIIKRDIIDGEKIDRLLYRDPKSEELVYDSKDMEFYQKQELSLIHI